MHVQYHSIVDMCSVLQYRIVVMHGVLYVQYDSIVGNVVVCAVSL